MEVTPGNETSEHGLTKVAMIAGVVMIVAGAAESALTQLQPQLPNAHWIGIALMTLGTVLKLGALLGYTKGRTELKATAIKAEAFATTASPPAPPAS